MNVTKRRIAGALIASVVVIATGVYSVTRLKTAARRGWAGMNYVPMTDTSKKGSARMSVGTTGISFEPGSILIVYPGGPAERAGLTRREHIVSINGIPAADVPRITALARTLKSGDRLTYHTTAGGRSFDRVLQLRAPFSSPMFTSVYAVTMGVALVYVVIGLFVFWRRPGDARAVVFLVMTLVAASSFVANATGQVDSSSTRGIQSEPSIGDFATPIAFAMSGLFFAPLLLHLSLIFPKPRPVVARRPYILRWVYGASIYICSAAAMLAVLFSILVRVTGPHEKAIARSILIGVLASALGAAVVSAVLLALYARRTSWKDSVADHPFTTLNIGLGALVVGLGALGMAVVRTHSIGVGIAAGFISIFGCIIVFSVYPISTIVSLYRSYRESNADERRQVKWPLWGTIIAASIKLVLSVIGVTLSVLIMSRPVAIPNLVTYLPDLFSKLVYVIIPLSFAFAILKYRLMNIDVIIRRTVLYGILSAIVLVLYGGLVAGVGTLLIRFAHVRDTTMVIASTIVVALVTVPLRNRLQRVVDRNLFRERRDYPLALRNIGNAIGSRDADAFLRYAAEQLQQAMQSRFVAIALRREKHYVLAATVGLAEEVAARVRIPLDAADPSRRERIGEELRRIGTALVVPVSVHRDPLGLIATGSKLSDQEINDEDAQFLHSAASQIALGIENSRLRTEEAEYTQARAIQQVLLPTNFPRLDGFDISGKWQPARSVGGDYFDVLALGDGKAAVCIGDVAGKGMPAALLMATLQAAVKATAGADVAPSRLCEKVKHVVADNLTGGKFISFFYGVVDGATRTLTYSNAGHNPPILVRADGRIERLSRGGPAFCRLFRDDPHEQESAVLGPGDRLVLFTDGASEARRGEEDFGEEHLAAFIAANRNLGAAELLEKIFDELTAFTSGNFADDVTMVAVASSRA